MPGSCVGLPEPPPPTVMRSQLSTPNSLDTAYLSPATRTPSLRACRTLNNRFHQVLHFSNPVAPLTCPAQLSALGSVFAILGTLNAVTRGWILVVGYFPAQHL